MKYYTKEWYDMMQRLHYTSGFRKIPDKVYSDEEIQAFYAKDLKAEIARDRRLHNTPPSFMDIEEYLSPDRFDPELFLLEDEVTGELFHPESPAIVRTYLLKERQRQEEEFAARPPFNSEETIECFEECYRNMVRYGSNGFPEWVKESVDPRLIALQRIPENIYKRLQKEERANRRAFERINKKAAEDPEAQAVPEEIREHFCFHDANVLKIRKVRSDVELYLRKDGYWPGDSTPYIRIIFKNVSRFEREKGFSLRLRTDESGNLGSGCYYLYDELYRNAAGYEVHMLFTTFKALRCLTIGCEDILFEDNITL